MATDSKSSPSNPNAFDDLTDEASDQSNIHSLSSNFRSTALIGTVNGLIRSHPLSPSPSPTTGLLPPTNLLQTNQHQTLPVGPRSGQLALSIGIRTPYVGLPRFHVQTRVDRHPYYHPGVTEISVTEIKTTSFVTPTSVADRFLQPSGIGSTSRGYDDVYQVSNATVNRLMLGMATRDNDNPYNYMRNVPQTQSITPSQQFLNPMPDMVGPSLTGQALVRKFDLNEVPQRGDQSLPLAPKEVLNPEPVRVFVPNDRTDQQIPSNNEQQKPDEAPRGRRPRTRVHAHSNRMNGEPSQPTGGVNESDQNVVRHDGRTHSLPCRKYGPYKCPWPRCSRALPTSQQFAAHTLSHYARETAAQRKRRRMARSRNIRFRASHSIAHGLESAGRPQQRQRRRQAVNIEAEESAGENELQEMQLVVHDDATSSAVGESSLGVKIKQEPEFSSTN